MNGTKSRPATALQVETLKGMLKDLAEFDREMAAETWRALGAHQQAGTLSVELASQHISTILQSVRTHRAEAKRLEAAKATPEQAKERSTSPLELVPDGRYAIDKGDDHIVFYRVKRYESGAYTVSVQASDETHRLDRKAARTVLQQIVDAGIKESAILYGLKLGVCSICGRSLTKKASRDRGMGDKCADDMGW